MMRLRQIRSSGLNPGLMLVVGPGVGLMGRWKEEKGVNVLG